MPRRIAVGVVVMLAALILGTAVWAYPSKTQDCSNCHGVGYAMTTTVTPSKNFVQAGATFTIAITQTNPVSGAQSGYHIQNPDATWGGYQGPGGATSWTGVPITAPSTTGSKTYTVYSVSGPADSTGRVSKTTFTITVYAAPGTMTKRWGFVTSAAIDGSVGTDGTNAFVGNDGGNIDAVSLATGSRPSGGWSSTLASGSAVKGRAVYYNGRVYFAAGNKVYVADATTKNLIATSPALGTTQITSTPAVTDTDVFVGADNGSLYRLDPNTLAILGTPLSLGGGAINSSPAVFQNTVYVGDGTGKLNMLTAASLTVRFTTNITGQTGVSAAPCIDTLTGKGFVGTASGKFWCFNATTGATSAASTGWSTNPISVTGAVTASPFVSMKAGAVAFATDQGWVYAVNESNGSALTGWPLGMGLASTFVGEPVIAPRAGSSTLYTVYLAGLNNLLYAIPLDNPSGLSTFDATSDGGTTTGFFGSPSITGGTAADSVLIGNRNGRLYSLPLK